MPRVLVVEDSSAMRSYVRASLEGLVRDPSAPGEPLPGFEGELEIEDASSGFHALRLLPRGSFDLLITDINMPDINGLELVKFVRQSSRHEKVAVLIISTQASARDRERLVALGADGFLGKPFTPEALREAALASLAKARLRGAS